MIEQKQWGEFLFALWKMIKANPTVTDWTSFMDSADKVMEQFPQPVFRMIMLGFLEQKSMESIREEVQTS